MDRDRTKQSAAHSHMARRGSYQRRTQTMEMCGKVELTLGTTTPAHKMAKAVVKNET